MTAADKASDDEAPVSNPQDTETAPPERNDSNREAQADSSAESRAASCDESVNHRRAPSRSEMDPRSRRQASSSSQHSRKSVDSDVRKADQDEHRRRRRRRDDSSEGEESPGNRRVASRRGEDQRSRASRGRYSRSPSRRQQRRRSHGRGDRRRNTPSVPSRPTRREGYDSHRRHAVGSFGGSRGGYKRGRYSDHDDDHRRRPRHFKESGTHSATAPAEEEAVKRQEEREAKEAERRQDEERKREDERRNREMDEARRDDQTVLVLNLSLKATERDIWKFFSEAAGKVRDIQLIRDSRSGKSKGVGYVEFFTHDAVLKALALSGRLFQGMAIRVQASQAEKNRAAKQAKIQAAEAAEGGPMKIYIGGLVDSLAEITSEELRQLFAPFGEVAHVDLHADPYTGKCRGFAFVHFTRASDAREAMAAMNGFEIAGSIIRVGFATDSNANLPTQAGTATLAGAGLSLASHHGPALTALSDSSSLSVVQQLAAAQAAAAALSCTDDTPDNERLDDVGGGLVSGASSRLALMQKLSRGTATWQNGNYNPPEANVDAFQQWLLN